MVEYFTKETRESIGVANAMTPCKNVSMGHKHGPHTHDFGTGAAVCRGYPAQNLIYIPRSNA